jgi:hypothetical protein
MLGENPILPFSAQSNVVYPVVRQFDPGTHTAASHAQDLMNSAPMIARLSPKSPNAMTPPTQSLQLDELRGLDRGRNTGLTVTRNLSFRD